MPNNATDMLGIGTLVLIMLCFVGGLICLAYVLMFHFRSERHPYLHLHHHQHHHHHGQRSSPKPLHDFFDSPWLVRIMLVSLFMMWSLGEVLRLPWLREGGRVVHSFQRSTQENLCKIHLVWSLGLMEPAILLTVLFLLHCSLNSSSSSCGSSGSSSNGFALLQFKAISNGRVLYLVLISCLPLFVLHLILVGISRSGDHHRVFGGLLPSYFTESHVLLDDLDKIVLCSYPLVSIVALALFTAVFIMYFSILGYKIFRAIINRKLRTRVRSMVLIVVILLPFHVMLLGVSVWMHPGHSAFEVVMLLRFLALLLCITAAIGVLVVFPIFEAMAVFYLLKIREDPWQQQQGFDVITPIKQLLEVGPLSEQGHVSEMGDSLLLQTAAMESAGSGAAVVHGDDGSPNLDTLTKDLTLGPGVWLVDVPSSPPHLPEGRDSSTIQ